MVLVHELFKVQGSKGLQDLRFLLRALSPPESTGSVQGLGFRIGGFGPRVYYRNPGQGTLGRSEDLHMDPNIWCHRTRTSSSGSYIRGWGV